MNMNSLQSVSKHLLTVDLQTVCYVVHAWVISHGRPFFLERDRVASFFAADDAPISSEELELPSLGFYAINTQKMACFCCGLECRRRQLLDPGPGGRNNPSCVLQAARIKKDDAAMFADYLDCLPRLPPLASLRDIAIYLNGPRAAQVCERGFPRDSVLFLLADLRLTRHVDLTTVTSRDLIRDLLRARTGQGLYYPQLDAQSSFAATFCSLVMEAVDPGVQEGGALLQPPAQAHAFDNAGQNRQPIVVTSDPTVFF